MSTSGESHREPSRNANPQHLASTSGLLPEAAEADADVAEIYAPPPSGRGILDGNVRSAVLALALPVLGEQALNACVTWNDAILAGRISAEATGAIGVAGYVSWLMSMLFGLVSIGATAIVARAVGAGRTEEVGKTTNQAFAMAIAQGLIATALVLLAAPWLSRLLGMEGEAAAIATTYMRIDGLGFVGGSISFALAASLRGSGDTRAPMKVLGAVNVLNLAISWVLTFGVGTFEGLGVSGIAWGTAIARWLGAFWIVRTVSRSSLPGLHLHLKLMKPDKALIGRILRVGVPAAIDGLLIFSGHFAFMMIVARVPSEFPRQIVYAAHIVGVRIVSLSYLPAYAWSLATSTLVGQNLGANQPERARRATHEALLQCSILLTASGLLYFFGAESLYRLLSSDPAVWTCGVIPLMWLAPFELALAPINVYVGALRGAGDTRVPMLISAIGLGLIRLPLGALFGIFLAGGLLGAWIGMFVDLVVRAGLLAWRFQSGRWKRTQV